MILQILDIPVSLNKLLRMHWAARKRIKNRWGNAVTVALVRAKFPRDFQRPPKKIKLDITIHHHTRGRLLDVDNTLKFLLDSLKGTVLYDDSPKWMELGSIKIVKSIENMTEIKLEEI